MNDVIPEPNAELNAASELESRLNSLVDNSDLPELLIIKDLLSANLKRVNALIQELDRKQNQSEYVPEESVLVDIFRAQGFTLETNFDTLSKILQLLDDKENSDNRFRISTMRIIYRIARKIVSGRPEEKNFSNLLKSIPNDDERNFLSSLSVTQNSIDRFLLILNAARLANRGEF